MRLRTSVNVPLAHTGSGIETWKNGMPTGTSTTREPAKELDEAEERDEERDDVDRPARRGQLEREGDEDLAEPQRHAPPPRQRGQRFFVEPAREEVVRVPRVVREEPLEILAREVARVGVEPLAGAVGRRRRPGGRRRRSRRRRRGRHRPEYTGPGRRMFAGV